MQAEAARGTLQPRRRDRETHSTINVAYRLGWRGSWVSGPRRFDLSALLLPSVRWRTDTENCAFLRQHRCCVQRQATRWAL